MKATHTVAALAAALFCAGFSSAVNATNSAVPTYVNTATSNSSSMASGGQGGQGGSGGSSNSSSNAAGGNSSSGLTGTVSGSQQQGSISDNSRSNSRFNAWMFPPPVFTPAMAAVQCPSAQVNNMAVSVLWSAVSYAEGSTDTSDCTLIQVRNAMAAQCKFRSAKQIDDLLVKKYLPAYQPSKAQETETDLTSIECELLMTSRIEAGNPQPVTIYNYSTTVLERTLEEPKRVAPPPAPKKKPKLTMPHGNCKWVCEAPK